MTSQFSRNEILWDVDVVFNFCVCYGKSDFANDWNVILIIITWLNNIWCFLDGCALGPWKVILHLYNDSSILTIQTAAPVYIDHYMTVYLDLWLLSSTRNATSIAYLRSSEGKNSTHTTSLPPAIIRIVEIQCSKLVLYYTYITMLYYSVSCTAEYRFHCTVIQTGKYSMVQSNTVIDIIQTQSYPLQILSQI